MMGTVCHETVWLILSICYSILIHSLSRGITKQADCIIWNWWWVVMNEHWTGGIVIHEVVTLFLCPLCNDTAMLRLCIIIDGWMSMEHWWNDLRGENCCDPIQCQFFVTDHTRTGLGLNLHLCGERPAADCLSHGTSLMQFKAEVKGPKTDIGQLRVLVQKSLV